MTMFRHHTFGSELALLLYRTTETRPHMNRNPSLSLFIATTNPNFLTPYHYRPQTVIFWRHTDNKPSPPRFKPTTSSSHQLFASVSSHTSLQHRHASLGSSDPLSQQVAHLQFAGARRGTGSRAQPLHAAGQAGEPHQDGVASGAGQRRECRA